MFLTRPAFAQRYQILLCLFWIYLNSRNSFVNCIDQDPIDIDKNWISQFENVDTLEYKHGEQLLIWSIKLHNYDEDSDKDTADFLAGKISKELNLINLGQVGELRGHYTLAYIPEEAASEIDEIKNALSISHIHKIHKRHVPRGHHELVKWTVEEQLASHSDVEWFEQEVVRLRHKRTSLTFHDPQYENEWHIVNHDPKGGDINVTGVWERNVTGVGAVVCVVDDGVEWKNKDLTENFSWEGSWDLNDEDSDPAPHGKESNHHGTRCAGEIAAVPNDICSVGVAYGAKVSGIRVLDGPLSDALEAAAFNKNMQINDVYSCSWGPEDNGKAVDGPHRLAAKAIRFGINFGRKGFGTIYVVASGNGGRHEDDCNFDGYANSIYTVTVGAVDEFGHMPRYGENCSAMLSVTYSNGHKAGARAIVTTDWSKYSKTSCTNHHTGTSAAAPIAAGMIALMFQVRPCLTWRDVQYIIVMTAVKVDVDVVAWQRNKAGLHHSHQHGFGLMKAWRLVNAAKVWKNVPWLMSFVSERLTPEALLPKNGSNMTFPYIVTESMLAGYDLTVLEQVQVTVTITATHRGSIYVELECPSGTDSILGATRSHDNSTKGLHSWTFTTVRCWGEEPTGVYMLTVAYKGADAHDSHLVNWQLTLFGTAMTPTEFIERRRFLKEHAYSGKYLNDSYQLPCPPPPAKDTPQPDVISAKTLKVILVISLFCVFMIAYEGFEYRFCNNEEKKEHKRLMLLTAHARRLVGMDGSVRPYSDQAGDYFQVPTVEDNDGDGTAIQMTNLSRNEDTSPLLTQPVQNGDSIHSNHLNNGNVDHGSSSSHDDNLGNGIVVHGSSSNHDNNLLNGAVSSHGNHLGNENLNNSADSGILLDALNTVVSSSQPVEINNSMATTSGTEQNFIYSQNDNNTASRTEDIIDVSGDSEGLLSKVVEPSNISPDERVEKESTTKGSLEGLVLGKVDEGSQLEMDEFALARAGTAANE